ncbi:major facilitator superfamily domain-containing protein [Aspergillus venezuelensis]
MRVGWKITSKLQKGRLLAAVNCLAGLAIFFFGMMGGVNGSQSFLEIMGLGYTDEGEAIVTATLLQGGITSVYYLGTLVGCFIGGSVGDRFGRIKSFAIGACWGIVGALLQCTAKTPSWIIVARLVNVAEYQSRGQFIAIEFTLNILGAVVAYWLGFGLSFIDGGSSEFFPESPRWLCTAGRLEEAHYVLTRLRGAEDMIQVEREWDEIEAVIELERSTAKKATYFHMLLGLGSEDLHIARQVKLSMWIAGLNNIFYTFATLTCVFTLDRIGRRWTLWWGAAGQAIAMFLAGGFSRIGLEAETGQEGWGIAATAMVYLYTFIFGATWLTVPWLYPAEIFPLMCWSLGNGSLTLTLPYVFDALGEKTMYVFGAVNVISIPIVWAFYPESSQRTLEEIDLLFAADSPWAWTAESNFQELRVSNPGLGLAKDVQAMHDPEKALEANNGHLEVVDNRRHEL